jgi:DNA-binding transcriptional LysR family regulator
VELEIRHYRLLVTVADTGSVRAAARSLGLSLPAATAALGRVERALGGALFDRSRDAWVATARGAPLVQRARRVVGTAESLTAEVQRLQSRATLIRVRTSVLPFEELLPVLRLRFPRLEWSVTSDTLDGALAAVAEDEADLVYGLRQADDRLPEPPGVVVQDLLTEQAVLLAPGWHPLRGCGAVPLAELHDSPWVVPADPEVEEGLRAACRRAGFEPDVAYRPEHALQINGVIAMAGGAVAPVSPVWRLNRGNVLLSCPGLPAYTWTLAHREDRVDPEVVAALTTITRSGYRALAAVSPRLV